MEKSEAMGSCILICGLNGAGKSTLGRALAQALECSFIDMEDCYFPLRGADGAYEAVTKEEAEKHLLQRAKGASLFVLVAVKGPFPREIALRSAVWVHASQACRMRRIRERSFGQFGKRMLPGGELHDQEERFFAMAQSRTEREVETWLYTLDCRVIQADGERPVEENVRMLCDIVNREKGYIRRECGVGA